MQDIIAAIVPIFLLILVGVVIKLFENIRHPVWARMCNTVGFCDDRWSRVLNLFALYVALPALIIHSLAHTSRQQLIGRQMLFTTVVVLVAAALFMFLVTKLLKMRKDLANAYILCGFFGNVAYIGPPFILALLPGTEGSVSVLIAVHVLVAFTVGVAILEHSKHPHIQLDQMLRDVLVNPLILAAIVGLLLLYLKILPPGPIDSALRMLAASASPTVLIAIGLFIARRIRFDKALWHAIAISGIKLIALPLIFVIVGNIMSFKTGFTPSILEAGMPVALANFALAEIYPMDKRIVAKSIIVSTVLSIFTLSALAAFVV
mgnify:CR=1 FL=1